MQPAGVSARRERRSASRKSTRPPSDEIRPPSKAALTFMRWTLGRSKGRRLSSVMVGVAFSLFGEEDARTTNSYPMATAYATPATPKSDPTRIIRATGCLRCHGAPFVRTRFFEQNMNRSGVRPRLTRGPTQVSLGHALHSEPSPRSSRHLRRRVPGLAGGNTGAGRAQGSCTHVHGGRYRGSCSARCFSPRLRNSSQLA